LFFNKIGPNNIQLDDEIYISCQPTGSSKEETQVSYSSSNFSNNNFADIFNNSNGSYILRIIFICIFFIIVFMLLSFGYNRLSSPSRKLSTKIT
jgi:hypothetical protein